MGFIQKIIFDGQLPVVTAFLLGLMVAVHPCPLATNIAAMGYIARDIGQKKRIFINGIYYTLGRIIAYSLLGVILYFVYKNGSDILHIGDIFGAWGEKLLAPILIIIGLYFFSNMFYTKMVNIVLMLEPTQDVFMGCGEVWSWDLSLLYLSVRRVQ